MCSCHRHRVFYWYFLAIFVLSPSTYASCVPGVYSDFILQNGTSYSDNNGSLLFNTDWIETDSSGGSSTSGTVYRTTNTITFWRNGGTARIERGMDFTGVNSATFIFDVLSQDTDSSDITQFEISYDGGSTWTVIGSHTGGSVGWQVNKLILNNPTQSANTRFRFNVAGGYGVGPGIIGIATFQVHITCDNESGSGSLPEAAVFETGQTSLNNTSSDTSWVSVAFNNAYAQPPRVFAMANTDDGNADPFALRIRNVTTTGFEVAQFEPPGEDGGHPSSTIDYFVFEEGIHTLPDGTLIEVGSYDTNKFTSRQVPGASQEFVNFSTLFSSPPIVISRVQTVNTESSILPGNVSEPWMTAMVQNIQRSGFTGAIERTEENGTYTPILNETIAYLAILPGSRGTFTDSNGQMITYEAQSTGPNTVFGWDDGCDSFSFLETYTSAPLVVGHTNSRDSGDGGWIRRCQLSNTSVGMMIDEDQDYSMERTNRDGEASGFLVFSTALQQTVTPTELLHLKMEDFVWDGTSNDVIDSSAFGHHLTTVNNPIMDNSSPVTSGNPGTCRYGRFGTSWNYMQRPVSANDGFLENSYTVAMWVNIDSSFGNSRPIAGRFNAAETHNDWVIHRWGAEANLSVSHNEGSVKFDTGINIASIQNNWHHLAFTYDGATIRSYLDGSLVNAQNVSPPSSHNGFFAVGRDRGLSSANDYYVGSLDEFYVYDMALDSSGINTLMTSTHVCPAICTSIETFPLRFGYDWNTGVGVIDANEAGMTSQTFTTSNGFQYDITVDRNVARPMTHTIDGHRAVREANSTINVSFTETINGNPLLVRGFDIYASDFETLVNNEKVNAFHIVNSSHETMQSFPNWTQWQDINGDPVGSGYLAIDTSGFLQSSYTHDVLPENDKFARYNISALPISEFSSTIQTTNGSVDLGIKGNNVQACFTDVPWYIDHFEVTTVTAPGSTCSGTELRVIACSDSATPCTPLVNYTGTVNLSTSSTHGNWSNSITTPGSGTLTDSIVDDGYATYTFAPEDQGVTHLVLNNSHADDLAVIVADISAMVSGTSPILSFRDNAFVLTPSVTETVAGRSINITAEVWKNDGVACGIATEYDGNIALKAWLNRTADMTVGASPTFDGVTLPSSIPSMNNVNLVFINGSASATLTTSDVGKFSLEILDDTSGFALDISGIRNVQGASTNMTFRPFAFDLHTNDDANALNTFAGNSAGSVFKTAGENFLTTVRAVIWQAADDTDLDDVPDVGANLSDNATAINFGNETTAESVNITHALNQPAGGYVGILSGGLNVGSFVNGSRQVNLQYNEVGIINLTVSLSDSAYLDSSNVSGSLNQIGRFVPSHFVLSTPILTEACSPSFSYMGDSIGISFDFEAQNSSGVRTQNYTGSFVKINTSNDADFQIAANQISPFQDLYPRLSRNSWASSINNGLGDVVASYTLNRAVSPDGPYAMAFSSALRDSDGITFDSFSVDADNDTNNDHVLIGTSNQRYGRMMIENNYGSELIDLSLELSSEYYNAVGANTGFIINNDDNCTVLGAGDISFSNYLNDLSIGETTASISSWVNGRGSLILSAPGIGNTGGVDITLDVPNWLEFDYKGLGISDPNAKASFGLFNSQSRNNVILIKEVIR